MPTLEAIVEKRPSIEDGSKEKIATGFIQIPGPSGKYQRMTSPTSASVTDGEQKSPFTGESKVGSIGGGNVTPAASRSRSRATARQKKTSRMAASAKFSRTSKTSHLFSEPLASEGEGSVFPVGLPLSKRRNFEVEIIQRFDRLAINPNVGDFWVIIDATWMNKWIDFVMGKADPPGGISNNNLFDEVKLSPKNSLLKEKISRRRERGKARSGLKLREGLQLIKHYRAVHPLVWFIYREIYNTDDAPLLCRQKPDLYAEEIGVSRRLKVEDDSHTKAIYEIRRFVAWLKKETEREGYSEN